MHPDDPLLQRPYVRDLMERIAENDPRWIDRKSNEPIMPWINCSWHPSDPKTCRPTYMIVLDDGTMRPCTDDEDDDVEDTIRTMRASGAMWCGVAAELKAKGYRGSRGGEILVSFLHRRYGGITK